MYHISCRALCSVLTVATVAGAWTIAGGDDGSDGGFGAAEVVAIRSGVVQLPAGTEMVVWTSHTTDRWLRTVDAAGRISLPSRIARAASGLVEIRANGGPRIDAVLGTPAASADRGPGILPPWDVRSRSDRPIATIRTEEESESLVWRFEWIPGARPLRVHVVPGERAEATVRVVDLETWESMEFPAGRAGRTGWVLDHPMRLHGVAVSVPGARPRISTVGELRSAPRDGCTDVRLSAEPLRRVEVPLRLSGPTVRVSRESMQVWIWDVATGILTGRGSAVDRGDGRWVVVADVAGDAPFEGLVQVSTTNGGVEAAWFLGANGAVPSSELLLRPSPIEYSEKRRTPGITVGAVTDRYRGVQAEVRAKSDESRRSVTGDGGPAVRVDPGVYRVGGFVDALGRPLGWAPIDVRVPDLLCAAVRIEGVAAGIGGGRDR